jgi:hypothetical protein
VTSPSSGDSPALDAVSGHAGPGTGPGGRGSRRDYPHRPPPQARKAGLTDKRLPPEASRGYYIGIIPNEGI